MFDANSNYDKIILATLKLAESHPWRTISFQDIAAEAGVTLSDIRNRVSSKQDILSAFVQKVDIAVLKTIEDDGNEEESAKDRLFDVIMTRLEKLSPYRVAIENIKSDLKRGMNLNAFFLSHHRTSNRWMLEAAGVSATGARGAVRNAGLSAVYVRVLPVWLDDRDPGLSKTMAVLDKVLQEGEKVLDRTDGFMSGIERILCGLSRAPETHPDNESEKREGNASEPSNSTDPSQQPT